MLKWRTFFEIRWGTAEKPGPTLREIREELLRRRRRKREPGWLYTPLATEVEVMVSSGLAHVWDEIPHDVKMLIRAWNYAQGIMSAWEAEQVRDD